MITLLITVHIMLVVALIVLVLLQRSEGGALGIGGGGGSNFMSARGAADAMTRSTSINAAGFFLTSIALGIMAAGDNTTENVLQRVEGAAETGVPTEGGEATNAPSAGTLLEDLQRDSGETAPSTGVPTNE